MAKKHYSSDWAKAKARGLVANMIKKHILSRKKPEEIHVLCFPGIDAIEVFEVYDVLGIPRQNVVGIERHKPTAGIIRQICPGIDLREKELDDYVAGESQLNFDILSVDFIGALDQKTIDLIKVIREKQKPDDFLFHAANLLRRDQRSRAQYVVGNAVVNLIESKATLERMLSSQPAQLPAKIGDSLCERVQNSLNHFREDGFNQEQKAQAYSFALRLGLNGMKVTGPEELLRFGLNYQSYQQVLQQWREKGFRPEDALAMLGDAMTGGREFMQQLQHKLEVICKNKTLPLEVVSVLLQSVIIAAKGKFYFVEPLSYERYSYISESGAPMLGDIYFAHRPREFIKAANRVAGTIGFRNGVVRDAKSISQAVFEFGLTAPAVLRYAQFESLNPKERTFLGNSAKPILTRKRFNEELEAGLDIESIQQKYRGWSKKPLSEWEAAYRTGQILVEEIRETEKDMPEKSELIQMLREGIPAEEIHEAWPSLTIPSLRAYQANLTRGAYGDSLEENKRDDQEKSAERIT
jgi:hypothetical protein